MKTIMVSTKGANKCTADINDDGFSPEAKEPSSVHSPPHPKSPPPPCIISTCLTTAQHANVHLLHPLVFLQPP